jgi:hypothetical protein
VGTSTAALAAFIAGASGGNTGQGGSPGLRHCWHPWWPLWPSWSLCCSRSAEPAGQLPGCRHAAALCDPELNPSARRGHEKGADIELPAHPMISQRVDDDRGSDPRGARVGHKGLCAQQLPTSGYPFVDQEHSVGLPNLAAAKPEG